MHFEKIIDGPLPARRATGPPARPHLAAMAPGPVSCHHLSPSADTPTGKPQLVKGSEVVNCLLVQGRPSMHTAAHCCYHGERAPSSSPALRSQETCLRLEMTIMPPESSELTSIHLLFSIYIRQGPHPRIVSKMK